MSRGNALTACYRSLGRVIPGFEVEVETGELTSNELVFEKARRMGDKIMWDASTLGGPFPSCWNKP
ncbi:unnamed protein product [Brassica oleracea var. botrytis]